MAHIFPRIMAHITALPADAITSRLCTSVGGRAPAMPPPDKTESSNEWLQHTLTTSIYDMEEQRDEGPSKCSTGLRAHLGVVDGLNAGNRDLLGHLAGLTRDHVLVHDLAIRSLLARMLSAKRVRTTTAPRPRKDLGSL
jgi:hypothetical protein